ncbi:MAG: hypothetical protein LBC45_05210 [Chlamydiales bacterium]|jgi:hypothetical protein|nr:hypothetical protein [Chlamydiales bacterium]
MTTISFIPGKYELSLVENGAFVLTPLSVNHQEDVVLPAQQLTSQQVPVTSVRFYTFTLGLVGVAGLVTSCAFSVLLPAVGSIGVIAFAYLIDRKITLLHAKELSSEEVKSQSLFEQRIGRRSSSESLLDESVDTDCLPPPILPDTGLLNQNTSNIPPPPPMSGPESDAIVSLLSPEREEEPSGKPSPSGIPNLEEAKTNLLASIRNSFNFMQTKELLKQNSEKYPSYLLLKELKTTYARALAIGESKLFGKIYFKNKIDHFEKNFAAVEQGESQTTEEMEDLCKRTNDLDSLLKNMQWAKSLLEVLSEREDLFDKVREYCSEKLKSIDKHIDKLQGRNAKKPKEAHVQTMASILARRAVIEPRSSSSSSESEESDSEEWEDDQAL